MITVQILRCFSVLAENKGLCKSAIVFMKWAILYTIEIVGLFKENLFCSFVSFHPFNFLMISGTVNSEPYIIPSEFMREELRRSSGEMQIQNRPQISDSLYYSKAFLEDLKVGKFIDMKFGL